MTNVGSFVSEDDHIHIDSNRIDLQSPLRSSEKSPRVAHQKVPGANLEILDLPIRAACSLLDWRFRASYCARPFVRTYVGPT